MPCCVFVCLTDTQQTVTLSGTLTLPFCPGFPYYRYDIADFYNGNDTSAASGISHFDAVGNGKVRMGAEV